MAQNDRSLTDRAKTSENYTRDEIQTVTTADSKADTLGQSERQTKCARALLKPHWLENEFLGSMFWDGILFGNDFEKFISMSKILIEEMRQVL